MSPLQQYRHVCTRWTIATLSRCRLSADRTGCASFIRCLGFYAQAMDGTDEGEKLRYVRTPSLCCYHRLILLQQCRITDSSPNLRPPDFELLRSPFCGNKTFV